MKAARTACLFIGSVVGAGFATGQEIALFFGGGSLLNLVISACFMGGASYLFLEMGAEGAVRDRRISLAVDTLVALCSFVVYTAMIASSESLLYSLFGVRNLSLILVLGCLFVSGKSLKWVSRLNFAAVPVMILLVALVGIKSPSVCLSGSVRVVRSAAYGAMNMLFSGALMMKEGERLSKKERKLASLFGGVLIFVLLLFMFRSVGNQGGEMPFLQAAKASGLGALVPASLLLAILTTMASCNYLVTDRLAALVRDPVLACTLPALGGVLLSRFGFSVIVNTAYPVVSYLGLVFSLLSILYSIILARKRVNC